MIRCRFYLVAALAVSGAAAAVERDTAQLELTQALTAVDRSRIATRRVGPATPAVLAANDRRVDIVIRSDIR